MTSLALGRIHWKELREYGGLFIVGCVAFLLTIVLTCWSWAGGSPFRSFEKMKFPLYGFNNLCGLLLGVLLFAPERENRTAQLLANFPVSPGRIAWSKLLIGAVALVGFMIFSTTSTFAVSYLVYGLSNSPSFRFAEIVVDFLLPFACMLIGVWWSISLNRKGEKSYPVTLVALVLGAASVVFYEFIASNLLPSFTDLNLSPTNDLLNIGLRVLLMSGLMTMVLVRTPTWNYEASRSNAIVSRLRDISVSGERRKVTSALVWQTMRQSTWIYVAGATFCLFLGFVSHAAFTRGGPSEIGFLLMLAPIGMLFFSGLTYSSDQINHQYRFFQQHCEHGRRLWLVRLAPMVCLAVLMTVAFLWFINSYSIVQNSSYIQHAIWSGGREAIAVSPYEWVGLNLSVMDVFIILVTAMAIGQLFSMVYVSPVIAMFSSMTMGLVYVSWVSIVMAADANPLLFILPIGLAALFATWYYAPAWLAESKSIFQRWFPEVFVAMVSLLVVAGFGYFRVAETQWPRNPANISFEDYSQQLESFHLIDIDDFVEKEAKRPLDTARAYRAALNSLKTTPVSGAKSIAGKKVDAGKLARLFQPFDGPSWKRVIQRVDELSADEVEYLVKANRKSLDLLNLAGRSIRPITFLNPAGYHLRLDEMHRLNVILICEYCYWRDQGDLEKARKAIEALLVFEHSAQVYGRICHSFKLFYQWSELPEQNPDEIRKAIQTLKSRVTELQDHAREMAVLHDRLSGQNQIDAAVAGEQNLMITYVPDFFSRVLRWVPWEEKRSRAVSDLIATDSIRRQVTVKQLYLNPRMFIAGERQVAFQQVNQMDHRYKRLQSTSIGIETTLGGNFYYDAIDIQLFRYAQIRMALNAYRLEKGKYPRTLAKLVPEYLDEIPCEVYEGGDFYYSPTGFDLPVSTSMNFGKHVGWRMWDYRRNLETVIHDPVELSMRASSAKQLIEKERSFLLPWAATGGQTAVEMKVEPDPDQMNLIQAGSEELVECYELSPGFVVPDLRFGEYVLPNVPPNTVEE